MSRSPHYKLLGKHHGDLTIIAVDDTRPRKIGYWLIALCKCGNTRAVYSQRFDEGLHTAAVTSVTR
jgi:hypothetical protein